MRFIYFLLNLSRPNMSLFGCGGDDSPGSPDGDQCIFNEFYPSGDGPSKLARPGEGQEVDAAWMSGVLNCVVKSCDVNAAAEGQTGVTFMVTNIVYEKNDSGLASSFAIKMHALSNASRQFAVMAKFYDKELFFYNQFKDMVSGE
jgi:hypothetical protein